MGLKKFYFWFRCLFGLFPKPLVYKEDGLTVEERKVLCHLVDAWNGFVNMKSKNEDDDEEFRMHLHILQRMIAIRVVRREYPDFWHNKDKT